MSNTNNPVTALPPYIKIIIFLVFVSLVILLLDIGESFLMPVSLAALLSILLSPAQEWLQRLGLHKAFSIIICILFLIIILAALIWLASSQLMTFARDIPELSGAVSKKLDNIQAYIESKTDMTPDRQINWVRDKITDWLQNSGSFIKDTISTTTSTLAILGLMPIYIFFFLFYKEKFQVFIFKLTDEQKHFRIKRITDQIKTVVQSYLMGVLTVIIILAILNTIGLTALGIKYALFLGVLAALLNIIPYIGILIGNIIAATVAFLTKDSIWYTVGVLIIFAVIQFIENNFLTPMITGGKVQINPLATIMALIIGGQLWGVAGMIIFIPFLGVIKVIFDNVEHLRPYGYLLGTEVNYDKVPEESEWQKNLKKLFGGRDPRTFKKPL